MEKTLKHQPVIKALAPGVKQIQHIGTSNSSLKYIEFQLLEMEKGASYNATNGEKELCIVVLTGRINVKVADKWYEDLGTRGSVFEQVPTDSIYIPAESSIELVASSDNVRLALCYSPAKEALPVQVIYGKDNTVEERGIYQNKRLVHNILPDTVTIASSLLVVEVYTEGGNFSSYPPHKHDQDNLPEESLLEETYYHELDPEQGFVFQRVYTEDGLLDETMTVEHQTVVEVPKGYHPVGVADGYTSYYLNVMAGPKRIWRFHNEQKHEWILQRE